MITIKTNEMEKYYTLKNEEQFLYDEEIIFVDESKKDTVKFLTIKYNNDYAILLNRCNRFIIGKVYKNCISTGSMFLKEFSSYEEAIDCINKDKYYLSTL